MATDLTRFSAARDGDELLRQAQRRLEDRQAQDRREKGDRASPVRIVGGQAASAPAPAGSPKADQRRGSAAAPAEDDDSSLLDELEQGAERQQPEYDETVLPEGAIVRVRFRQCDVKPYRNRTKWYVTFAITEPRLESLPLLVVYNEPTRGRIARSHNLWRDWMAITELRPPPLPRAKHKILDALFKGCELHARTRRVRVDHHGTERGEAAQYSVIAGFGGKFAGRTYPPIAAGCPLVMQRRRSGAPRPRPGPTPRPGP